MQRAGVDWAVWDQLVLSIGVVGAIHFLIPSHYPCPPPDRFALICMGGFAACAVLQVIPLPAALVRLVSPARFALMQATAPLENSHPATLTLSAAPGQTIEYILTVGCYILLFLLIRDFTLRLNATPWCSTWPLLLVGGAEAALGFYQGTSGMVEGAVTGTYVNYDHYAGLLEMILPLAVAYGIAVLQRDRTWRASPAGPAIKACVLFGCATLLLIGVVYSLSRMGFICALASLFIVGSMTVSLRGWRVDYEDPSRKWRTRLLAGCIGITVLLAFVFLPTDPLVARFSDLARTDEISADTRVQIWRDTVGLIKAYPLSGCGLGAYESCFLRFKTAAPMNTVDYAHNDYLQVLAELGIFGFLAGLLFVIHLVRRTIRGALYARSIDERYLAIGCSAAMIAMLLHSLVDFNMYVPVNAMVFAWIAGVSGIFIYRRPSRSRNGG